MKKPITEREALLHDFNIHLKKSQKIQTVNQIEPVKSESRIQAECVAWYRNTYCLKHHNPRCMILSVPNEGRGAASSQLINTGLYPGCADLCVIHRESTYSQERNVPAEIRNRFSVTIQLFIEVKTPENLTGPKKNGQSKKQIAFEIHCISMGIPYFIVRSLEEFCQVIEKL